MMRAMACVAQKFLFSKKEVAPSPAPSAATYVSDCSNANVSNYTSIVAISYLVCLLGPIRQPRQLAPRIELVVGPLAKPSIEQVADSRHMADLYKAEAYLAEEVAEAASRPCELQGEVKKLVRKERQKTRTYVLEMLIACSCMFLFFICRCVRTQAGSREQAWALTGLSVSSKHHRIARTSAASSN